MGVFRETAYTKLVASGNHVEEERLTGTEMVWEAQIAVGAALGFCDHLDKNVNTVTITTHTRWHISEKLR